MYPIIFKIGNLAIRTYGLILLLAFFICLGLAKYDVKRMSWSKKVVDYLVNYLLLGGLIGARLSYAIFYDPVYYFTKPWTLLFLWEGGLAIHGAIIGGLISMAIFSRKKKIDFFILADFIAPIFLLGQAIGRIGCYLNGCCYGYPTDKPFGVIFPKDSFAYYQFGYSAVHPTQIYELVLNLIGFILLWSLRRKFKINGYLFSLYLIYYGLIRFTISFFRAGSLFIWGTSIKVEQVISIIMFLIGIFMMRFLKSTARGYKGI